MTFKLALIALGVSVIVGGAGAVGVNAQETSVDPSENAQSGENDSDLFSNGQPSSIHDFIHQAQLGQLRDMSEFNRDQRDTINSQATDFRTRQLELLQQTQPAQSGAIVRPDAVEEP